MADLHAGERSRVVSDRILGARGPLRECDDPAFVIRCEHLGRVRVWIASLSEVSKECRARGLPKGGACPRCGQPPVWGDAEYGVTGPGVYGASRCICHSGMRSEPVQGGLFGWYFSDDRSEADRKFDELVERMAEPDPS